ncbi:MAG: flotillin-like FloA family protein, partial [Bacteroidota bacterium]
RLVGWEATISSRATAKAMMLEAQAIAEAFRSGNLGVMDYYNLRNIEADTKMRNAIGGDETPSDSGKI